jgi:hypothetical protein
MTFNIPWIFTLIGWGHKQNQIYMLFTLLVSGEVMDVYICHNEKIMRQKFLEAIHK